MQALKTYTIRIKFPAEYDHCQRVTWIEVQAKSQKQAEHLAKLRVLRFIEAVDVSTK